MLSSLAVLAGSVIHLRFNTAGGLVTLIGAFLASPIPAMIYTNNWTIRSLVVVTNSSVSLSPGEGPLMPGIMTSPVLLLAGALEIPQVRQAIGVLARKLGARYYTFLES